MALRLFVKEKPEIWPFNSASTQTKRIDGKTSGMVSCRMANGKVKPKLNFTLLCDDVRQEVGGKYSLMGLFEGIHTNSFPAVHHSFAIVNEWAGGKGEFTVRIRLLAPDREQVLSETESMLNLFNESQRHREISVRINTIFKVPGMYWIEVLLDEERAGMVPFPIHATSDEIVH